MAGSPKFVLKKIVLIILLFLNSAGLLLVLMLIIRNPSQNGVDETAYVRLPVAEEKKEADKETEIQFPALSVISKPEGAGLYIDGYHEGSTPLEFPLTPEYENRSILVTLLKEGYEKWEREISIEAGEEKEMKILLRKKNERDK